VAARLAGQPEVALVSSSVHAVVARCMPGVEVEVMVGLWLVLHSRLRGLVALVGAAEGSMHHIGRSFVSVAEIDMP